MNYDNFELIGAKLLDESGLEVQFFDHGRGAGVKFKAESAEKEHPDVHVCFKELDAHFGYMIGLRGYQGLDDGISVTDEAAYCGCVGIRVEGKKRKLQLVGMIDCCGQEHVVKTAKVPMDDYKYDIQGVLDRLTKECYLYLFEGKGAQATLPYKQEGVAADSESGQAQGVGQ